MTTNDGGPAFPRIESIENPQNYQIRQDVFCTDGMSLRDWFAGKALPMCAANDTIYNSIVEVAKSSNLDLVTCMAKMSYQLADAMLADRERKND